MRRQSKFDLIDFVLGFALVCTVSLEAYAADGNSGQYDNFDMDELAALIDRQSLERPANFEASEVDDLEDDGGDNQVAEQAPNWKIVEETNPLDDTRTVQILTDAVSGKGSYGAPISLIIRCMSNEVEAFINWNSYLGSDDLSPNSSIKHVTIRFGKNTPIVKTMGVSTNGQATFFRQKHLRRHLEIMALHDTFVAQVVPYNENPVTAVFNTEGMAEVLQPVQAACGW